MSVMSMCMCMINITGAVARGPEFSKLVDKISEVSRLSREAYGLRDLAVRVGTDPSWVDFAATLNKEADTFNMKAIALGQEIRNDFPPQVINLAYQAAMVQ